MFNFLKRNIYVILLVVFPLITYHTWLFTFGIIKTGDWGYYYKEAMSTLNIHWFGLWLGDTYGRVLIDIGQAPTYALYGYLTKFFNFDFVLNQRLVYLYPVALFTPLFSYLFLRTLKFNKTASFVGALVYAFNTYFLVLQTGHMTLMGAFCFAPLVILMYIETLNILTIPRALITGLLLSLEFAYEPRAAYVTVWILFFYAVYFLFFVQRKLTIRSFLKIGIIAFIPVIVLGLLNLYWVIGLANTSSNGIGIILGRSLFGDEFYNILYSLTLFHPFWTGKEIASFHPQPIPPYFWIIPLFAILGLFLNRKNKYVLFFGFISLLGIFFSKQVAQPFVNVYPWLYSHLPGFSAFREASKFYFLVALGYSVLIGAFINWLWKNWTTNKLRIYGKYLLAFLVVALFLWNTKSLITGEAKTLFIERKINNDYLIVKNFIKKQDEYFRTFWVPQGSHFSFTSYIHPLADWSIFQDISKRDINEQVIEEKLKPGEVEIRLINKSYANSLLDLSSVKYVFVPLRETVNDDDDFISNVMDRGYYIKELNKIPYLSRINIGTKGIVAYENKNYRPHIYITTEKETIYKDVRPQIEDVRYEFVSPTEYTVALKNIVNPVYLNFSESYHPQWNLRVGNFNWLEVLLKGNYFISDNYHFENEATFNSYYLNPKQICKKFRCIKNKDGSYNINMTLYFAPQSYVYLGLIMSGGVLILVIGYLMYILGRNFYEKKN